MKYHSLSQCVADLKRTQQLIEITDPVDPVLEAAEIHRRVFSNGGPAVLYSNVKGCSFPMLSNLFGSPERAHFLFRNTFEQVRRAIEIKLDPGRLLRQPLRYWRTPSTAWRMRPIRRRTAAVLANSTTLDKLPHQVSWPRDGGAFITLPMVYSEDVDAPGWRRSNLGMYRIQLSGGEYQPNLQIGLHYQIHRGIGVHHQQALKEHQPFRVSIFVGGTPAMTLAAVFPAPEGMTELGFAGALAGFRIPMTADGGFSVYSDADFVISGVVDPTLRLPEGPFGDHLGYYSLQHDYPVMHVQRVSHRNGAIWPFTVVGRPPQEDTMFGGLIHELTERIIPFVLPGIREVHAVDAAGVHPLLLAVGSERYQPYRATDRPQEILTQANALLGQGQLSLAKYLLIIDGNSWPQASTKDLPDFFMNILQRVDWTRDLHFQTQTTIDTLDYSGSGLNHGSKVVVAAAGPPIRRLGPRCPEKISDSLSARLIFPGAIVIQGPPFPASGRSDVGIVDWLVQKLGGGIDPEFPLIVVVDDSDFASGSIDNFIWVTFTRSNPATDIHGFQSFVSDKHWGCRGSLIIDARSKPHHAPVLESDPEVAARVDALAARGRPISRFL